MKYCSSCGVQHETDAKFCKECGFNFTTGVQQSMAQSAPQIAVKPKKSKKEIVLAAIPLALSFMFFFLPYYSVTVRGGGNTRWFSLFGTIQSPGAESGSAAFAFYMSFVILALVFARRILPAFTDKIYILLAASSIVAAIANIVMMNTVTAIEAARQAGMREVNAGPVFFIAMLLYIVIIAISIRESKSFLLSCFNKISKKQQS